VRISSTSVAVVLTVVFSVPATAQQTFKAPAGPTPRTPSGKVDFSGVWQKT